jgi:hypothetical protein
MPAIPGSVCLKSKRKVLRERATLDRGYQLVKPRWREILIATPVSKEVDCACGW